MLLKELKDVIDETASVSIQYQSNRGLPILYDSWKELKNDLKENSWNEEIKLTFYAGIQILFVNIRATETSLDIVPVVFNVVLLD